jgi:hypothetical protein
MAADVFNKHHYSTLKPTSMCLQLADQSIQYPIGIVGHSNQYKRILRASRLYGTRHASRFESIIHP